MAPVFSIIVPVYNVEKYLEEAIISVLAQSFKDFELIIVNDGSTDGSVAIAERFAKLDTRIQILHKQNGGLSSARNEGIKNATGTYLYFLDSDDSIKSDTLERINGVFKKEAIDIVAFTALPFFEAEYLDKNLKSIDDSTNHYARHFLEEGLYSCIGYYENCTRHNNFVVSACLYFVKRSVVNDLKLQFYEGIIHEDALFTRQLFLKCDKVFFIKEKFYNRRIRINSISTSPVSVHKAYSYLVVAIEINKLNVTLNNNLLNEDVLHFYYEALGFLKSIKKKSVEYNKVIKYLRQSDLYKQYKFDFNSTLQLKYKNLANFKNFLSRMRYKAGLRTRIKFFFNLFKRSSHNANIF